MNLKKIGLTAFVAIVSALVTIAAYNYYDNKINPVSFEQRQATAQIAQVKYGPMTPATGQVDFRYAAKVTTPAVVHIKTSYTARQVSRNDQNNPFRDFFGDDFNPFNQPYQQQPSESSGSGVIISNDGYIVTNNHVVDGGDKIQVIIANKKSYEAKVIGTDPSTDLALLKIDESNLPFIPFGNSDSVEVGQWVLAVGNPFNLESTVTAGIVSAKGRNINIIDTKDRSGIEAYIQTDAAVNPGNSGGALVNTDGELVGINSAISTHTGVFEGYSFAVPVNIVSKVVNDLLKFGMVQRGFLGIGIATINDDLAKAKHIDDVNGVYVDTVNGGSSAEEAGIKQGDIITKINGIAVNTSPELQEQVSRFHPGDKITVTLLRDGKEKTVDAVLKNKEGSTTFLKTEDENVGSTVDIGSLGAQFSNLSSREMKDLGVSGGVKVVKISDGTLSRYTDIHEGFIITKVNNKTVNDVNDLKSILSSRSSNNNVLRVEGRYPGNPLQYYYSFGL